MESDSCNDIEAEQEALGISKAQVDTGSCMSEVDAQVHDAAIDRHAFALHF